MSASDRPIGVALVGHSFMGKAHSNAWRNVNAFHPDTPAVARRVLVGRDRAATAAAARQYGWDAVADDWRSVLDRDDVDVVDVCTPGHLHAEITTAALAAGKHVLVEKPAANSVPEAEQMAAAAEAAAPAGVVAMVGFNYRRVPALALARRLVADGRLGEVRQARVSYLQDWLSDPAAPMTWRLRRETAGSGVIGDLGSHAVDQLGFLLGQRVTAVSGHVRTFVDQRPGDDGPEPVTVEDAAWATMWTDGGVVASVEASRMATGRKNALRLELYGSSGSLAFDLERLNELRLYDAAAGDDLAGERTVLVTEPDHPYVGAWWPPGHVLGWDDTFTNQAADFLRAVVAGEQPRPSLADGLAVQRVLAAIERSAHESGRVVEIAHPRATEVA
jgi:predicted dehydrogenase